MIDLNKYEIKNNNLKALDIIHIQKELYDVSLSNVMDEIRAVKGNTKLANTFLEFLKDNKKFLTTYLESLLEIIDIDIKNAAENPKKHRIFMNPDLRPEIKKILDLHKSLIKKDLFIPSSPTYKT